MYESNTGSKLMNLINRVGTVFMMNMMFLVGCIPLVTIGASFSGLYSSIRFMIRKEGWFSGYREGFKTGFVRNTIGTVFGLLVAYYALDNFVPALHMMADGVELPTAIAVLVAFGALLLVDLLLITVMIPVNLYIRTDYDRWLKNTFYVIGHAPLQSVVLAALTWFPIFQALTFPADFYLTAIAYVAIYYAFVSFAGTIMLKNTLIRLKKRETEAGTLLDED